MSENERTGIVYVYGSFNNTIAQITDMAGNTIGKVSGGQVTKHNRLKANPTIAMFIGKKIKEMVRDHGIKSVYVKVRGQRGF
jgi:small subunit ribosomal protein S11